MAIVAPQNKVEETTANAVNSSTNVETGNKDTVALSTPVLNSQKELKESLNPNRSNDENSGSPPTDLEKETGFRGGVAEANSTLMPDDQQSKIPDD